MKAVASGLHLERRDRETIVFRVMVQKADDGDGPSVVLNRRK